MSGSFEALSPSSILSYIQPGSKTDLNICYSGNQACEPGGFWGPLVRDHYVLHYIHDGQGLYRASGREFSLSRGQIFVIYPGSRVYYKADNEKPWVYTWFGFCGACADEYLARSGISPENPVWPGRAENDSQVEKEMDGILEAYHIGENRELLMLAHVYRLLFLLSNSVLPLVNSGNPPNRDIYLRKAVEFIQLNYPHKITVRDISEYIGIDRKYLCSLFKKFLSLSPQQYLMRYRVEKSCRLMEDKSLSVGEAARSVGYEDPLSFSKLFKRLKGETPSDYRKKLQG